jgi:hypothetical protein
MAPGAGTTVKLKLAEEPLTVPEPEPMDKPPTNEFQAQPSP